MTRDIRTPRALAEPRRPRDRHPPREGTQSPAPALEALAPARTLARALPDGLRVSTYVAGGLVLALVAAAVLAVVVVRRPLPQTGGELEVAGLSAPVDVVRDEHGVPQLYGSSVPDLALAQGYVDKLFTYQTPEGGWGYYDFEVHARRPAWATSFMTASAVLGRPVINKVMRG